MKNCPDRDLLERLLTDRLVDTERDELDRHVRGCALCQQTLEHLTDDPIWRSELRHEISSLLDDVDPGLVVDPLGVTAVALIGANEPMARVVPAVPGYEITGELGRGGMGVVYQARHVRLNRLCAIKMILAGAHAGPDDLARFVTEAEAIARLQHPSIVQIRHIGDADGLPFLELEYLAGGSLEKQIDGAPWPTTRAAQLAEQVALGIAEAHRQGIVHRDLKPSNVLLAADGTPKVSDFGLAKMLDSQSALTRSESVMGSPSYMAPEQAKGHSKEVGAAVDVYAVGAILYELLTGRPPFRGTTAIETLEQVKTAEPVPPSRLVPGMPRDIETICLKCLQKEPGNRYGDAALLAADLERFREGRAILARPIGTAERAWRWCRRNRWIAAMTGIAVTAASVGLAALVAVAVIEQRANLALRTSNRDLVAANERERARFNLAMDAVGLFHGDVSQDVLLKEKPFTGLRTKLLRGAVEFYGKLEDLLSGQTDRPSRAALARAFDEIGKLTDMIGSGPEALSAHRKALAVRRELADGPQADVEARADLARSLLTVGWMQFRTGDIAGALASYEETQRLAESLVADVSAGDPLHAILGSAHQRFGRLFEDSGKPALALSSYERALSIRKNLAAAHPEVIEFQSDLGTCYIEIDRILHQTGKSKEALNAVERALSIRQELAKRHPDVTQFQSDLALCHDRLGYELQLAGKPAEALASSKRALEIRQKLAAANPNVTEFQFSLSHIHQLIGWMLRQTGKPAEAVASFERAVAIMEKVADANPNVSKFQSELALDLCYVGSAASKADRTADAVTAWRRAVTIWTRMSSRTPTDLYNLACTHASIAGLAAKPGSGMTAADGRADADQAMESLHRAVAAGYRRLSIFRTDPDLDVLRGRPDFRLLIMDLAFPSEPFVRR
jgi:tetratricopeptide (TPR) repeat protein